MGTGKGKIGLGIVCSLIAYLQLAHPVFAQAVQGLDAIRVALGLSSPLFTTAPPGDCNRLFIVQQNGVIRIFNLNTGMLITTLVLTGGISLSGGYLGLV